MHVQKYKRNIINRYFRCISLHRKNQAQNVLGRCLKDQGQLSQVIIVSRQLDYNIDLELLQLIF